MKIDFMCIDPLALRTTSCTQFHKSSDCNIVSVILIGFVDKSSLKCVQVVYGEYTQAITPVFSHSKYHIYISDLTYYFCEFSKYIFKFHIVK
jgi:hypothetical protein